VTTPSRRGQSSQDHGDWRGERQSLREELSHSPGDSTSPCGALPQVDAGSEEICRDAPLGPEAVRQESRVAAGAVWGRPLLTVGVALPPPGPPGSVLAYAGAPGAVMQGVVDG